MRWRSVPMCDACWVDLYGERVPHRCLDPEADDVAAAIIDRRFVSEACFQCAQPTRGIYVRAQVDA